MHEKILFKPPPENLCGTTRIQVFVVRMVRMSGENWPVENLIRTPDKTSIADVADITPS